MLFGHRFRMAILGSVLATPREGSLHGRGMGRATGLRNLSPLFFYFFKPKRKLRRPLPSNRIYHRQKEKARKQTRAAVA